MFVAALSDVRRVKIWADGDEQQRKSKRRKDLSDIIRLVETYPLLKDNLPAALLSRTEKKERGAHHLLTFCHQPGGGVKKLSHMRIRCRLRSGVSS